MIIAGIFSFNNGKETVEKKYPHLLKEIEYVILSVDAGEHIIKESKERTMKGKMLYSPVALNKSFKKHFASMQWTNYKVNCEYPTRYYTAAHNPKPMAGGAFRDMDFVKEKLGVEVQFGKYAFMVYNVCAKMTIFHNLGVIDTGVEIVPIKEFADEMSTGVSYFEQFVWDLEKRGSADIDIPVMIIGISY
ncbi:MAG: restriction endonuclease [Nitrospirae bacterium YQR-1]